MTDKEKILQEIERLQKPTMDANHNFTSDYNQGFYDGLSRLELFLDKIKEKPVSNDLKAEFVLYLKHKFNIPQEGNKLKTNGWNPSPYDLLDIAKHFAQWQKEQMIDKACEWLKENKEHSFIGCEDPCLSGYLTDEFIEEFKKAMEE